MNAFLTKLIGIKLKFTTSSPTLSQVELDCSQQDCESLQEQLQLQRKTAASSLNRIQKHSHKKTAQLQVKIRELSDKLKEVGHT